MDQWYKGLLDVPERFAIFQLFSILQMICVQGNCSYGFKIINIIIILVM